MRVIYSWFLLIVVFSCNISCSQKTTNRIELPKDLKIDSFLYDHFPVEICTDIYSFKTSTNEKRNNVAFFLKYSNCIKNIDSLFNVFEKSSIKNYTLEKECLLIINSTETKETLRTLNKVSDSLDFFKTDCNYVNEIPIPNINMYFENSTSDYDIYIFEAKKGEYSKFYKFSYNTLMPSYWNHGYSKGVAFSKSTNEIIYWGCMW